MRLAWAAVGLAAIGLAGCAQLPRQTPADRAMPRYAHIIVILEENKSYDQILDPATAPNIAAWSKRYGVATRFYGEVHPSEANYVALLGGDTFGIHDDDAFYCKPGQVDPHCPGALRPGYVDHTTQTPHIGDQLERKGLTWKAYLEDLPAPGSLAVNAGGPDGVNGAMITALYASKHSGFVNFASVQKDPHRAQHLVDFKALDADLAAGALPSFALIVPNQCNEMHGMHGPGTPEGCDVLLPAPLIRRGDAVLGQIIGKIQAGPEWRSDDNVAIIITFDEGVGRDRQGCCAVTPQAPSNYGGGHIPTFVLTNHGPQGVADDTPYNHYSLLRTVEDAFGVKQHLGLAAATDQGVVPMTPLFVTSRPAR